MRAYPPTDDTSSTSQDSGPVRGDAVCATRSSGPERAMGPLGEACGSPSTNAFELLEVLGTGAFATTYKARVLDAELCDEYGVELVALKIPHASRRRILQREITLNAVLLDRLHELEVPQIVRYLGFEVFRGSLVMVMEYVPSGTLRERLRHTRRSGRMAPARAVAIIKDMLRGLAVLHEAGVLHRDLKPENILLSGDDPKLADLGVARLLAKGDRASTCSGSLLYMAPEQLLDDSASFQADIWAIGVILYEMVTGRTPFGDEDAPVGRLVQDICFKSPVPASDRCPEVPRSLSNAIDAALEKQPERRIGSARELLDRLEGLSGAPQAEGTRALACAV